MRTNRTLQRGAAVALTAALFATVLPFRGLDGSYHVAWTLPARQNCLVMSPQWPMLGGSPSRNMANPLERNLPIEWGDEDGKLKNIKWIAERGSKSHGGPVIAGARVFVSTNNQNPRDKKLIGNVFGRNGPIDLGGWRGGDSFERPIDDLAARQFLMNSLPKELSVGFVKAHDDSVSCRAVHGCGKTEIDSQNYEYRHPDRKPSHEPAAPFRPTGDFAKWSSKGRTTDYMEGIVTDPSRMVVIGAST